MMRQRLGLILAGLLLLAGAIPLLGQIVIPGSVTPPPAMPVNLGTLNGSLAARTGLTEKQVEAVLKELGPAVADRLASGQPFELQGVGSFRVIRIASHRELVDGIRAIEVPARNTIQLVSSPELDVRLNRPGAIPGFPVGSPDFNPIPNRVPSLQVPSGRLVPLRP